MFKFPQQKKSFSSKGKKWRREHLEWAKTFIQSNHTYLRSSFENKRINYNLIAGIVDPKDIELILNPFEVEASFINTKIQHYPLINSKLTLLMGEEWDRGFNFNLKVSNPNVISEIGERKKREGLSQFQEWIENGNLDEETAQRELEDIAYHFQYTYQDLRERDANYLIHHYYNELDMKHLFNKGFIDPLTVGEEIYRCDIVGGEPIVERVNNERLIVLRNNQSSKIEDASIIIYWEFKSPNSILDEFYDVLTPNQIKQLEDYGNGFFGEDSVSGNDLTGKALMELPEMSYGQGQLVTGDTVFFDTRIGNMFPTDFIDASGNVRVLRFYWKSFREIHRVKQYNMETGDAEYHFYPETYKADEDAGEEIERLYINEAWEATLIGKDLAVNMRPRLVQYNRMSNPSLCHFGFIGEIYTLNGPKPYSIVDMMKPYNYFYDVIHERLLDNIKSNYGALLEMDLAKIPAKWNMEKWLHFAKVFKVAVTDSFKEGTKGPAKGKLVGNMNIASKGMIDMTTGNQIQSDIQLLEYIKITIGEFVGITKQREGNISNRETVGGIERSTLQSNYITNWLFATHNSVKKRVIECFIDTAKIALRGRSTKFQYILPDKTYKTITVDGDLFADCDYGVVCEDMNEVAQLKQDMKNLALSMVQNNAAKISTFIKLTSTSSPAEMMRLLENEERMNTLLQQETEKAQRDLQAQIAEQQAATEEAKMQLDDLKNERDNQTRLMVAEIQAETSSENTYQKSISDSYKALDQNQDNALAENKRQFDTRHRLDLKKFEFDKNYKNRSFQLRNK